MLFLEKGSIFLKKTGRRSPLGEKMIPGKSHRNLSYGVECAQTAFATSFCYILKCCNPIGPFHRLPVACVGFAFFPNKVDVDLPLDGKKVSGKFHRICLYGLQTHSEQTNRHSSLYI